jgi:NAD(P)-dependent dehydrogenase (short-subunit alcohol dehydrogenase family)
MARRFASEGMKLVLADIEESALARAEDEFKSQGLAMIGVKVDVSKGTDIERLALRAYDAFGAVHVLCNNAGVAPGGLVWENSVADWEWCLGINVWGVIHGVRVFVPRMLAQESPCHILNTASVAGLLSPPGMGIYCVSKHAVVTLSECLYQDLQGKGAKIGVSVLCPAYVLTNISDSERNRPADLKNPPRQRSAEEIEQEERLRHAVKSGRITADQVADKVFEAIRDNRFYILTHQKIKGAIEVRMKDILEERSPTDTSKPRTSR